jgi:hypothetical protein
MHHHSSSVLASAGRSALSGNGVHTSQNASMPPNNFSLAAGLAELQRREADVESRRQIYAEVTGPDYSAGMYGSSTFGGSTSNSPYVSAPRKQHRFHSDLNVRPIPGWLGQRTASREAISRERDILPPNESGNYFAQLATVAVSPFEKGIAQSSYIFAQPYGHPYSQPQSARLSKPARRRSTKTQPRQPHSAREPTSPMMWQLHTPQQQPQQSPPSVQRQHTQPSPQRSSRRQAAVQDRSPRTSHQRVEMPSGASLIASIPKVEHPPDRVVHMPTRRQLSQSQQKQPLGRSPRRVEPSPAEQRAAKAAAFSSATGPWNRNLQPDATSSTPPPPSEEEIRACTALLSSLECPLMRLIGAPLRRDDVITILTCALDPDTASPVNNGSIANTSIQPAHSSYCLKYVRSFARAGYAFWCPVSAPPLPSTDIPSADVTPLSVSQQVAWICDSLHEVSDLRHSITRLMQSRTDCAIFDPRAPITGVAGFDSLQVQSLIESVALTLRMQLIPNQSASDSFPSSVHPLFRGVELERQMLSALHHLNDEMGRGGAAYGGQFTRMEQLVTHLATVISKAPVPIQTTVHTAHSLSPQRKPSPPQQQVVSPRSAVGPSAVSPSRHLVVSQSHGSLSSPKSTTKNKPVVKLSAGIAAALPRLPTPPTNVSPFPSWPSLERAQQSLRQLQQQESKEQMMPAPAASPRFLQRGRGRRVGVAGNGPVVSASFAALSPRSETQRLGLPSARPVAGIVSPYAEDTSDVPSVSMRSGELRGQVVAQQSLIESLEAALLFSERARVEGLAPTRTHLQQQQSPKMQSKQSPSVQQSNMTSGTFQEQFHARKQQMGLISPSTQSPEKIAAATNNATALAAQRSTLRIQKERMESLRNAFEAEQARELALQQRRDAHKPALPAEAMGRSPTSGAMQQHKISRISAAAPTSEYNNWQSPSRAQQSSSSFSTIDANQGGARISTVRRAPNLSDSTPSHPSNDGSEASARQPRVPARDLSNVQTAKEENHSDSPSNPLPSEPSTASMTLQRKLLRMHLSHLGSSLFSAELLSTGVFLFPPRAGSITDSQLDAFLTVGGLSGPSGDTAAQRTMALIDQLVRRRIEVRSVDELLRMI